MNEMEPPNDEIVPSNSEQDPKKLGASDRVEKRPDIPNTSTQQDPAHCLVSLETSLTSSHQDDSIVSVDSVSFNLAIEEDVLDFEDFDDPCKKNSDILEKCDNLQQSSDKDKSLKDAQENQNVDKAEVSDPKQSEGSTNLWVSGISLQTKAKDLFSVFRSFGNVIGAKVLANSNAAGAKCFAFVTMGSSNEATRCIIEQENIRILGKSVTIKLAQSKLTFSKTGKMTALKKEVEDTKFNTESGGSKRKNESNVEQKTSLEANSESKKSRRSGSPRNKSPLRRERLEHQPSCFLNRTRENHVKDMSMVQESSYVSRSSGEDSRQNGRVKSNRPSYQERPFRVSQRSPGPRSPIRVSPIRPQSSPQRSSVRQRSPIRTSPVRQRYPVTRHRSIEHRSPQPRSLPLHRSPQVRSPPKHRVPQGRSPPKLRVHHGRSPPPHRTSQRRTPPLTHGSTLRRSLPRQRSPRRSPPKQRSPQRLLLQHGSPPRWQTPRQRSPHRRMSPPRQRSPQRRSSPPRQRSDRQELPVSLRRSPPRSGNPLRRSPYQPRSPQQRSSSKYRRSPQRQRSPLRNYKETSQHDYSPWRQGSSPERVTQKPVSRQQLPTQISPTQRSPRMYNTHEHKSLLKQGSTGNCKYPDQEPSPRISKKSCTQTKTFSQCYSKNLQRSPFRHANSKRESPLKQHKDLSRLDFRGSPKRKFSTCTSSGYDRLSGGNHSNGAGSFNGHKAERREEEQYVDHKRPKRSVEIERSKILAETRQGMQKLGHSNVHPNCEPRHFGDLSNHTDQGEPLPRRGDPSDVEREHSKLARAVGPRDPWAVSTLSDSEKSRPETTNGVYHPKMIQSSQALKPQEAGNTKRIKIQNPFADVELSSTETTKKIPSSHPFYNTEYNS